MSEPGTRPGGLTALAVINFIFAGFGLLGALGFLLGGTMGVVHKGRGDDARGAETRMSETRDAAETREEADEPEVASSKPMTDKDRQARAMQDTFRKRPDLVLLAGGASLLIAILEVISGIGYLKLKRLLGKKVGTIYALLAIGWGIAETAYVHKIFDQSLGLLNLIGFIYPAITLLCLHVVFKDDFVNP